MAGRVAITAGFLPLLDAATLIAAAVKGFASDEQIALRLVRETSWANLHDRTVLGDLHVAHMPASMPLATNLSMSPARKILIAPMVLGLGGSTVAVSAELFAALMEEADLIDFDPRRAGRALKAAQTRHAKPFRIAVSCRRSDYVLRYWLLASGIDPDRDMSLVSVPPADIAQAFAAGRIDGCCVGEPWGSQLVDLDLCRIITMASKIWRNGPQKVLGMSTAWAEAHPPALDALLRALYRSAEWCANPANIEELAGILAAPAHIGVPGEYLLPGLTGHLGGLETAIVNVEDFFSVHHKAATFPWQSHALWFYSQMARAGHCPRSPDAVAIARDTYRPDLYRRAMKPLFAPLPGANMKMEGALTAAQAVGASNAGLILGPDGFFDGYIFDPDRLDSYIDGERFA